MGFVAEDGIDERNELEYFDNTHWRHQSPDFTSVNEWDAGFVNAQPREGQLYPETHRSAGDDPQESPSWTNAALDTFSSSYTVQHDHLESVSAINEGHLSVLTPYGSPFADGFGPAIVEVGPRYTTTDAGPPTRVESPLPSTVSPRQESWNIIGIDSAFEDLTIANDVHSSIHPSPIPWSHSPPIPPVGGSGKWHAGGSSGGYPAASWGQRKTEQPQKHHRAASQFCIADSRAGLGFSKEREAPENLDTGPGGHMEAIHPIFPTELPRYAKGAERRKARGKAREHTLEPARAPEVLHENLDPLADSSLPEAAQAKRRGNVPSDEYPDIGEARSEKPCTIKTPPACHSTDESTTKATQADPDSSQTDSTFPCRNSAVAVEFDTSPSISRCQSPWLEHWFKEGSTATESFQQFGARIRTSGIYPCPKEAPRSGEPDVQGQGVDASNINSGEPIEAKTSGTDPCGARNSSSSPSSLGKRSSEATREQNRGAGGGNDRDFDDRDNNDGPSHPRRRRITGPADAERTLEKYACPYQKRYPVQNHLCGLPHGKRTFYGWDTVSRVKQHVLRSHGRCYHCSHCWKAFSVKPDDGKCKGGKCPSRPQPDKHWLADEQVVRLETEKIPNNSTGWYRLVAILFPDMEENGQRGYRSSYTPYYCMRAEPTAKLASEISRNAEMNLFPSFDFAADAVPEFPWEDENTADAPDFSAPFGFPGQLEMGDAVQTCFVLNDEVPGVSVSIVGPNYPAWENTITVPGGASGDASRTVQNSTADESRRGATYATTRASNSTPSTDPAPPSNPYCSCTLVGTCSHCRLKQRVTRLEVESESLRATIETARSVVGKHDGILQDVHDSRRAPDSVMEELWRYQEELRKVLSSCRE